MSTPSKEVPQTQTTGLPGPRASEDPAIIAAAPSEITAAAPSGGITGTATATLALLRMALGGVFAWAFLDKLFGLSYSTPTARAWINGGSPTKGFLGSIDQGPFAAMFRSMAGTWWCDWTFMIALAGLGVALLFGIGLRIAAVAGTMLMGMMWLAEWPPAKLTNAGQPTGSTNPLIDYHVVYAIAIIALAALAAGHRWGLGRMWSELPIVQRNRWLI
jgi:thiosulfate dehydrogenase [quinone] large subunit